GDRRRVVSVRRLVVGGDDFGAAREVNAAIVRAHREGILTSTSLMVTGDAAAEAAALARENPRLGVGLHLVLVQGRPAAPAAEIPALRARDGAFRRAPVPTGLRYAWLWLSRAGRAQLRREIVAQLDAFVAGPPAGLSEPYCHPSVGASATLAPYQRGYDQAGELAALTSARVRAAIEAAKVELVSYADRCSSDTSSRRRD